MIGAEKGTLGELNYNDIFAYQFKHVFCVLKRTVSMRRFFLVTTTMFGLDETKTFIIFVLTLTINPFFHIDVKNYFLTINA